MTGPQGPLRDPYKSPAGPSRIPQGAQGAEELDGDLVGPEPLGAPRDDRLELLVEGGVPPEDVDARDPKGTLKDRRKTLKVPQGIPKAALGGPKGTLRDP